MEISAVSVSKAVSSTFYASFSDKSHLEFYGRGSSSFLNPSKLRCKIASCRLSASQPVMVPVRAFCSSPGVITTPPTVEEALMKELADLKVQMKQKKKELKARVKDDKKKLKLQMKERKSKKQNDAQEGKKKMKSSSSSCESCSEECSSVSMSCLRRDQSTLEDTNVNYEKGPVLEKRMAISAALAASESALSVNDTVEDCNRYSPSIPSLGITVVEACSEKYPEVSTDRGGSELYLPVPPSKISVDGGRSGVIADVLPVLCTPNRIEVCAGGKCRKAGSQGLLLALQGQIPRAANVEAVPCKCMGKCSMAINVRVLKEDANPQHHSHVGTEDGSFILSHHFGLGSPTVELPALSLRERIRTPMPLVTA